MNKTPKGWEQILTALKGSRFEVLRDLYNNVENVLQAPECRKCFCGKNVSKFSMEIQLTNKKGGSMDVKKYLSLTKNKLIEDELFDEIMFEKRNDENTLLSIDKLARFQTKGNVVIGRFMSCDDGKNSVYDFEIKDNKVTKCKEYKQNNYVKEK